MLKTRKPKNTASAQPARQFRFDESLALFWYMLSLFGKESLDLLYEGMNSRKGQSPKERQGRPMVCFL